jgi:hypothetical protein
MSKYALARLTSYGIGRYVSFLKSITTAELTIDRDIYLSMCSAVQVGGTD